LNVAYWIAVIFPRSLAGSKSKLETATPQQLLALIKKQQVALKKSQARVEGMQKLIARCLARFSETSFRHAFPF
jgi:hypothetical protein